jgi:Leucine-rich repeat (LRR) protein
MKKYLIIITSVLIFTYLASCRKLNPIIPTDTLCLPCQNKVTFVDKNLEQAVKNAIGKGSCDICSDDLVKVTSLSIQAQVNNYTGFQNLVNLNTLTIANSVISDFNFLSGLTQVTTIDVTGCHVMGLAGLDNDANPVTITVTNLKLSGCNLSDISGLSKMQGLTWLAISNNNITSIAALTGTANLRVLLALGDKLTSLAGLENDTGLNTIVANTNLITDVSALQNLINMRYLDLGNNRITSISDISGLTALQYLDVGFNNITDIEAISGLTSLTYLTIWHNYVTVSHSDGVGNSPLAPLVNNADNNGIGTKTYSLLMSYYNGLNGPTYTAAELADINYLLSKGVRGLQYQF